MLSLIDSGLFEYSVSNTLVIEYEYAIAKSNTKLTDLEVQAVLNYLVKNAKRQNIYYLWRPNLSDEGDNFVLELAVAAQGDYIVTYNKKDFKGAEKFNISVLTPFKFFKLNNNIGEYNEYIKY